MKVAFQVAASRCRGSVIEHDFATTVRVKVSWFGFAVLGTIGAGAPCRAGASRGEVGSPGAGSSTRVRLSSNRNVSCSAITG